MELFILLFFFVNYIISEGNPVHHYGCHFNDHINEPSRSVHYHSQHRSKCDYKHSWGHYGRWVRFFQGEYNARIPQYPPSSYSCTTYLPGWVRGRHPTTPNVPARLKICYAWYRNKCEYYKHMDCVKCYDPERIGKFFFVYLWKPYKYCTLRICTKRCIDDDNDQDDHDDYEGDDEHRCGGGGGENPPPPPPPIKCFGKEKYDDKVCSRHGKCVDYDTCDCDGGYEGLACNYLSYDKTTFPRLKNVEADIKFFCYGKNSNFLCTNSTEKVPCPIEKPEKGDLEGRTIRLMCSNEYYALAIDSYYQIYIWGDSDYNSYLDVPTTKPTLIDAGLDGLAKKLACTRTSLFILTFRGVLYEMGRGEDFELSTGPQPDTGFRESIRFVHEVEARDDAVFIVTSQIINDRRQIKAIGRNKDGSLGVNSWDPYFISWTDVYMGNFPFVHDYPKMRPFEDGCIFSFRYNQHYVTGRDHPTSFTNVNVPTLLKFEWPSQIRPYDPIDFYDRTRGGCVFIVSENRFFVSGRNCPENSLITPKIHPYQITEDMYGDFIPETLVYDVICSENCFILTKDYLYSFGPGKDYVHMCTNVTGLRTVTNISGDVFFIMPSVGSTNVFGFWKPNPFVWHSMDSVNKYPPEFDYSRSSLIGNTLTVTVRKKMVFGQLNPTIKLGLFGNNSCEFEGVDETSDFDFIEDRVWEFWNFGNYDFYRGSTSWSWHVAVCGWQRDDTDPWYIVWLNKIYFEEKYFLRFIRSALFPSSEDFTLDVMVKVRKNISLCVGIEVQKLPFNSQVMIFEKNYDSSSRVGELRIKVEMDYPLFINSQAMNFSFTNQEIFYTIELSEEVNELSCDPLHCYQTLVIDFKIYENHPETLMEICNVKSDFTIKGDIICFNDDPNCEQMYRPGGADFTVHMLTENICSEFTEYVELNGSITVYNDWKYIDESLDFMKDDYAYFEVSVWEFDGKLEITKTYIEEITFGCSTQDRWVLFSEREINHYGKEARLIIDEREGIGEHAFHFQLLQWLIDLNYDETDTFCVCVKISVEYLGEQRRSVWSLGEMKRASSGQTAYIGVSVPPDMSGVVATTVGSIVGGLLFIILLIGVIVLGIYVIYKLRIKRVQRKKLGVILKEKETEEDEEKFQKRVEKRLKQLDKWISAENKITEQIEFEKNVLVEMLERSKNVEV